MPLRVSRIAGDKIGTIKLEWRNFLSKRNGTARGACFVNRFRACNYPETCINILYPYIVITVSWIQSGDFSLISQVFYCVSILRRVLLHNNGARRCSLHADN